MLNKRTFIFKMNELLVSYPNWKIKNDDPEVMRFWHSKFNNMNDDDFVDMVDAYIENENFNPTIAGLKKWDLSHKKSVTQIEHEKMLREHGLL